MASEVCSHVKVVVRVRPFNNKENGECCRKVVQVVDNHMLIFDPVEEQIPSFGRQQKRTNRDLNKKANKDLKYVFDHVFGEDSTQEDIFENTTKGILDGVMNGFNCTVFAYGATGAGKTHTMLGCAEDPGVMYRTMKELFRRMDEMKEDKMFEIAFSYLEVYNEQIRDLIKNIGPLNLREDPCKGVVIQGLTLHQPKTAENILEALDQGNRNRTQHPTDMNATSSRSHAVFQIYLRQKERTASLNPTWRVAKFSLIDLAGSEKASATNAKGVRQREGANINRSLLALGNVINALADPKQSKRSFIPYRDSKLTRLLKDSLGGNCRTVMIANVSPASYSYDDIHNTLKYANRAKDIRSSLKSNVVSLDSHIGQYAVICERQKQEIVALKKKLQEYEEGEMATLGPRGPATTVSTQKLAQIQQTSASLQSVFSSRAQIRRKQLLLERQLKENELRRFQSQETNAQILLLCTKDKTDKATCKHERRIASLQAQRQHLHQRLDEAKASFLENDAWLHRLENDMKLLGEEAHVPENLQKDLQCHKLLLQVEDLTQHIQHMTHLVSLHDQDNKQTRKMVNVLLPAYSRHYAALAAAGLSTASDELENQELERLVQRERGVAWADQEATEEPQDAGSSQLQAALPPYLSFSHLLNHQSTPCSAEKHRSRVAERLRASPSSKGPAEMALPTRRKLCVSSPAASAAVPACSTPPHRLPALPVLEVLRTEEMFPLQFTPEPPQNKALSALPICPNNDPNATFEISEQDEPSQSNATIILSGRMSTQKMEMTKPSCPSGPGLTQLARVGTYSGPKRLEIPLLLDSRPKPLYMSMTSAALRKRKNSSLSEDNQGGAAGPKRWKQEPSTTGMPSRVLIARPGQGRPVRLVKAVSAKQMLAKRL